MIEQSIIDRHFIKEMIDEGLIQVQFVRSEEQIDILTKGVCNVSFMRSLTRWGSQAAPIV
jgi:hypothetical protein